MQNIKDPFNDEVNYSYDKIGRLATMTGGTTFAGIANYPYLSSVGYRAWGAIKDGRTYDTRMRVSSYSGFGGISYQYDNASQLTTATMSGSEPYTQSFSYDPAGRLIGVTTPEITAPSQYVWTQASPPNGLPPGFKVRPFSAGLSYDEFGNMTGRSSAYWTDVSSTGPPPPQTFQTTYVNGRANKDNIPGRVATSGLFNQTWYYDNVGNITADASTTQQTAQQYDVSGNLTQTLNVVNQNVYSRHTHDGDGRQVKFEQRLENAYYSGGYEVVTRYRIYSSVTGKLLTEIDAAGQKIETHVSALGGEYRQMKAYAIKTSLTQSITYPEQIVSEYGDPKGTRAHQWDRQTNTYKDVHMSPVGVANAAIDWQQVRDRFVGAIGAQISFAQSQSRYPGTRSQLEDPTNPGTGCELDGKSVSCAKLVRQIVNGGIRKDSIIIHGVVQGPGYGGGRQDDGEGNLTDISLVIANGDINGDLIVGIGDAGGGPQTPTKTPCDAVLPTDPDQLAVLSVLMHELTAPDRIGMNQYQNGDKFGTRTGPKMIAETLQTEALYMASVIRNYASAEGKSVSDAIMDTRYIYAGTKTTPKDFYDLGIKLANDANQTDNDSNPCNRLKRAINAATYNDQGPGQAVRGSVLPSGYRWWKGTSWTKNKVGYVRTYNLEWADIRMGDSDFTTYPGMNPPKPKL